MSETLDLELQVVMIRHVGAGNRAPSSGRAASALPVSPAFSLKFLLSTQCPVPSSQLGHDCSLHKNSHLITFQIINLSC